MRAFLATLWFACSILCGVAEAPASAAPVPPTACVPTGSVIDLLQSHPSYRSHDIATPAQVRAAADIFNAVPPETDFAWTAAVLVSFMDGSGVLLVGEDEMLCGSLRFGSNHWPALIRAVRGTDV
jgi:hypothetical protein